MCQGEHWTSEHKHKCKELNDRRLNWKKQAAATAVVEEEEPVEEVVIPVVTCASCRAKDPTKRCTSCKKVKYCNRECQMAHWGQHKAVCQK